MSTLTRTKPVCARRSLSDGEYCEGKPSRAWDQLPINALVDSLEQGWSPRCESEARGGDHEWAVIKTTAVQPLQFQGCENKRLPAALVPREHLELRPGDLLITRAGPRSRVGVACLVRATGPRLILCDKVYRLRCKRDVVHPEYLELALNAPHVTNALNELKTGISDSGVNLTQTRFGELVIPVPRLSEQRKIVAEIEKQFTRLDAGVAALKRVQANLKRYRAAVLKAACEGRLVPTEAELARKEGRSYETGGQLLARVLHKRRLVWSNRAKYSEPVVADTKVLSKLPTGWAWATLDSVAAVTGGITKDQKRNGGPSARSIPYLRVANVQRGYLDLSEMKEILATEDDIRELALQPGDILFNEGGDRDKLGRGWVWGGEIAECIHQNHVFRARLYDSRISPKYVSWYGNTFGQRFFFDQGKHTTNLASISMSKLKALPIPVPPCAEQTRIITEVERYLSVVEELEAVAISAMQRSSRLRQSVLSDAFLGP